MSTGAQLSPKMREQAMTQILERMAEGETIADAVQTLGLRVTPGAVRQWFRRDEAWHQRYEQAKLALAQALAEEAIRVARDSTNQSSAADRLLIDTLKWAASKANPREYGERQTVEHQGGQKLEVVVVDDPAPAVRSGTVQALESATVLAISAPVPSVQSDADDL